MAEEFIGVVDFQKFHNRDNHYRITVLQDGNVVKGVSTEELVRRMEYVFHGQWKSHPRWGPSFEFVAYAQREPHDRDALLAYILRYAPDNVGLGRSTALKMIRTWGEDTLTTLREHPEVVSQTYSRITEEKAKLIAARFQELASAEQTRLSLMTLFAGRGFPGETIEACIRVWYVDAYEVIHENPFVLLQKRIPGCGFARVDSLYLDLGHNPAAICRQMFCIWHYCKSDMSGSTWLPAHQVIQRLREAVTAVAACPAEAVAAGEQEGWIATLQDKSGTRWITDAERATDERHIAAFAVRTEARQLVRPSVRTGEGSNIGTDRSADGRPGNGENVRCSDDPESDRCAKGDTQPRCVRSDGKGGGEDHRSSPEERTESDSENDPSHVGSDA